MDEKAIKSDGNINRLNSSSHPSKGFSYDRNLVDYPREDTFQLRSFAGCSKNSYVDTHPQEFARKNCPPLEWPKLAPLRS